MAPGINANLLFPNQAFVETLFNQGNASVLCFLQPAI